MTEQTSSLTSWHEVRRRYSERFGGASPAWDDDEDAAVSFGKHPGAVLTLLDELARSYDAGKIHSPWRIFAKRLPRLEAERKAVDVSQDARIRLAELWIQNAGLHLDREDEVVAWLFDDRGLLAPWAGEDALRERMLALWRTERPRGEASERDRLERATRFKAAFLKENPAPRDRPKPAPYAVPKPF